MTYSESDSCITLELINKKKRIRSRLIQLNISLNRASNNNEFFIKFTSTTLKSSSHAALCPADCANISRKPKISPSHTVDCCHSLLEFLPQSLCTGRAGTFSPSHSSSCV
ncbi:hypothetical protein BpHYR1_004557 [Brachionus plicatilis]|uniref:Uncharacterized protein n=1 Tax=Brachionus plicatilis TaxID=10195 RepID=A0A3M7P9U8_BRAPC|nr:hypothetical protein BpHYR1_004557 [Brachionus plicatilis]